MIPSRQTSSQGSVRRDIVLARLASSGFVAAVVTMFSVLLSPFLNIPILIGIAGIGAMTSVLCFGMIFEIAVRHKNPKHLAGLFCFINAVHLIALNVVPNVPVKFGEMHSVFSFITFVGMLFAGVFFILFSITDGKGEEE